MIRILSILLVVGIIVGGGFVVYDVFFKPKNELLTPIPDNDTIEVIILSPLPGENNLQPSQSTPSATDSAPLE